ncbi:MAG: DUF4252 domain-containing protein [Xanthomonadales bacterium]|nr:DUF4252 domain-containing protein [Xanthomonadales bacterium]
MRVLTFLLGALLALPAFAQEDALRDLPGYIDFGRLSQTYGEPKVEIALGEPLIQFVSALSAEDEPETAELLRKLRGVSVRVYDTAGEPDAALAQIHEVSSMLQSQAWAPIVRVREEGERVDIYVKMAGEAIDGLVVMAAGDDNEAVFVNVIGSIRPDELQRVMDSFDMDVGDIEVDLP